MSAAKKSSKPIVDVAHPGKSAPSPTSKPVIITNRPILKDPMMVDEEATDETAQTEPTIKQETIPKSPSTPKLQLSNPPAEPADTEPTMDKPVAPEKKSADEGDDKQPVTDTPIDESSIPDKDLTADKETEVSDKENKPGDEDQIINDESVGPAASSKSKTKEQQKLDTEAAEQAKLDSAVQKLVDDRQYFLPINSVEKRRTKRFVVLGIIVSLLLALAWVDIALDAGLIHIGSIKPLTHFFSS